jgi:dephospho-CoA kinase
MAIGPDMMAQILEELGCFLVDAGELAREVAPQLAVETAAYEVQCTQAAIDALRQTLSLRDREQARQPLREGSAPRGGVGCRARSHLA